MSNYDKAFETKKLIATLHYMGVSVTNKNVITFINVFIKNKFEGANLSYTLKQDLHSNNVRILNGLSPCEEFIEIYGLFDDNKIPVETYWNNMQEIKKSIIAIALSDIWEHYKIGYNYDTQTQLNLMSRLLKIDLQFPFKFEALKFTTTVPKTLLNEYFEIMDIVSTTPYSYVENNEVTVQLEPEVIMLLNTHFSSKHKIPKSMEYLKNSVLKMIESLKVQKYSNTIFIIHKDQTTVTVNGEDYVKTDDLKKSVENNESTIVTDSLLTLNTDFNNKYDHFFVSENGVVRKYIRKTGKLHNASGTVHVR